MEYFHECRVTFMQRVRSDPVSFFRLCSRRRALRIDWRTASSSRRNSAVSNRRGARRHHDRQGRIRRAHLGARYRRIGPRLETRQQRALAGAGGIPFSGPLSRDQHCRSLPPSVVGDFHSVWGIFDLVGGVDPPTEQRVRLKLRSFPWECCRIPDTFRESPEGHNRSGRSILRL